MTKTIGERVVEYGKNIGQRMKSGFKQIGQKLTETKNKVFGTKTVPDHVKKMAKFAEMAYEGRKDFDGYQYLPNMSDKKRGVWSKGNTMIIAERGTDPANMNDMTDDAKILLGQEASLLRAKQLIPFIKSLYQNNPEKRFILTGHSLGSSIIMQALEDMTPDELSHIDSAWAFNPGVVRYEEHDAWKQKLRIHRMSGDPISISARPLKARENKVYQPDNALTAHSISNFTKGI